MSEPKGASAAPPRPPADLPRALRPRERLFARGPRRLAHGELLTLVLGCGGPGQPAARTALRLVRRHGLRGLARLSADEWRGEQGVGPAGAARLCAVFELGRRAWGRDDDPERPLLGNPQAVWEQVRDLARARKERLVGLYLDAQNGLIHRETISVGSLNTTRSHPREILWPAVVHLAYGFILAHNHPSGSLEPSAEDIEFTRAVRNAADLLGIELYDHLIVARGGFTSLRERGVL